MESTITKIRNERIDLSNSINSPVSKTIAVVLHLMPTDCSVRLHSINDKFDRPINWVVRCTECNPVSSSQNHSRYLNVMMGTSDDMALVPIHDASRRLLVIL